MNNYELIKFIGNEILKHKQNYEKGEIEKIKNILRKVINVKSKDANAVGDEFIGLIGSDHIAMYYYKNIWVIDLLIKILENSAGNKARIVFCTATLGDLYYFGLDDMDELSVEEYEIAEEEMRRKLYPYSNKNRDDLVQRYLNIEKNIANR